MQGTEAGGHQGGFGDRSANHRPLLELLGEVREVSAVPAVGSGGIMDGVDAAAALAAGAVAVQLGTAFLCTPEAGTSAPHRAALLDGRYPETVVSPGLQRAVRPGTGQRVRPGPRRGGPGRLSRGAPSHPPAPGRRHPGRDASVPNLWAGTGWRRATTAPAAVVVRRLAAGIRGA